MKDIPVFATENGVGALSLQQIPYTGFAHISIHSSADLPAFLQECRDFCRAAGAETILACGHTDLAVYPKFTRVLSMQLPLPNDISEACLFPATEDSYAEWLRIYNDGMKHVPNAAFLSKGMGKTLLQKKAMYFVHAHGTVLGIGAVEDDRISAIVSCMKGAGECVMRTLFGAIIGDAVKVEVAENNVPAMKLYRRMGFVPTGILKTWYDVTKNICDVK